MAKALESGEKRKLGAWPRPDLWIWLGLASANVHAPNGDSSSTSSTLDPEMAAVGK